MKLLLLWSFFLITIPSLCMGQMNEYARVGEVITDYRFTNIKNHERPTAAFSDFRGKWLVVEFWYSGCRMCIESLPKIDELQKQLGNQVKFLLVGCTHPSICYGSGLEDTYERLAKKLNLNLTIAFDSAIVPTWGIYMMPRIFIIDPDGVIRAETDGRDMTKEKLQRFIAGGDVPFFFERDLKTTSGGGEVLFKSMLRKSSGGKVINEFYGRRLFTGKIRLTRIPLFQVFNLAYTGATSWYSPPDTLYGKYPFMPLNETRDPNLFAHVYETSEGFVDYELDLGSRIMTREEIMMVLQEDLRAAFNFRVSIEKRILPVWKLVATSKARTNLATKHSTPFFSDRTGSGGVGGFTLLKGRTDLFMALITKYINKHDYPYFDETGISGDIDITIDAPLLDFEELRTELRKNGLDLVLGQREMNAIIIRD